MKGIIKNIAQNIRIILLRLRSLIIRPLNVNNGSVLIVAPHPDDEVIGCAGLIQQCLNNGQSVTVVILTGGDKSHENCCDLDENTIVENRRSLSRKAAGILGLPLKNLYFLNYPDGSVAFEDSETDKLKQLIEDLRSDSIFIPHKGEGWSDHIEVGNILRKLITDKNEIRLYEYCVWFWYYNARHIDWKQARSLKMNSAQHHLKLQAMDAYIRPLAPCGKPWSGILPQIFIKANSWNRELYFEIK